MATPPPSVQGSLTTVRPPSSEPIRLPIHSPTSPLPCLQPEDRGRWLKHLHEGLKPLGKHLPVPSPSNSSPLEGNGSAPVSALLASTAIVRGVAEVVLFSSPPWVGMPLQRTSCISPGIISSSRLEFLWGALRGRFSQKVVGKTLRTHCPSSVRQYESYWRRFQDYLRRFSVDTIS